MALTLHSGTKEAKEIYTDFYTAISNKSSSESILTVLRNILVYRKCGNRCKDIGIVIDDKGEVRTLCCNEIIFSPQSPHKEIFKDICYQRAIFSNSRDIFLESDLTAKANPTRPKEETFRKEKLIGTIQGGWAGVAPTPTPTPTPTATSIADHSHPIDYNRVVGYTTAIDGHGSLYARNGIAPTCNIDSAYVSTNKKNNDKKENDNMNNNLMKNFNFGPASSYAYKLSYLGVAYERNGSFYAYDKKKGEVVDVTGMTFDANNMIYKMPVAVNSIKVSDIVLHMDTAMVVLEIGEKDLTVLCPSTAEKKVILPVKSIFGFDYYTKLVSLIDFSDLSADKENPFGNLMPLMFMNNMNSDKSAATAGRPANMTNSMMPLMMMKMFDKDNKGDMSSKMFMMMAMSGGNMDMNSMLPLMMLGGKF